MANIANAGKITPGASRPAVSMPADTTASRMAQVAARPAPGPSRLIGVREAQANRQSKWLTDGNYLLRVLRTAEGRTRMPADRPYLVGGFTILRSEGPAALPVGHEGSYMIMLDRDAAMGNVKALLEALMTDAEKATLAGFADPAEADAYISNLVATNGFAGREVLAQVETVSTKRGTPFTKASWFPVPPAGE